MKAFENSINFSIVKSFFFADFMNVLNMKEINKTKMYKINTIFMNSKDF